MTAMPSFHDVSPAYRLAALPKVPRGTTVEQFSSRNKKGLNDDAGWSLYKDAQGRDVLFDAVGPGCIRSWWATGVSAKRKLLFFFDDEDKPRLRLTEQQLFSGEHPLFPAPLSSFTPTGRHQGLRSCGNCFVPIPYSGRLRIATGPGVGPAFYHIITESYPAGSVKIPDFVNADRTQPGGAKPTAALKRLFKSHKPGPAKKRNDAVVLRESIASLKPSQRTYYGRGRAGWPDRPHWQAIHRDGAGTVERLCVSFPAEPAVRNNLYVEVFCDNQLTPTIFAPVDLLFANVGEAVAIDTPTIVTELSKDGATMTGHLLLPQPFWKNYRVRLINYRAGEPIENLAVQAVVSRDVQPQDRAGYLVALAREGLTTTGRDWVFEQLRGSGTFVGVVHSMAYDHNCEGDEHFFLDGSQSPAFHGTGTEDYYLTCFWPNLHVQFPFGGHVGDIGLRGEELNVPFQHLPSCYFRWHLEAPIPFYSQADLRIQHGSISDIHSEYRSLAFCYVHPQTRLQRTDTLDVASPASEAAHNYTAPGSRTFSLTSQYEADDTRSLTTDTGRKHHGEPITFTLTIDPNNAGVRLRRRLDQKLGQQLADIFVNGQYLGRWYWPDQNPWKRWVDDDLEIPAAITAGQDTLEIRIEPEPRDGKPCWNDFHYEAYIHAS